MIYSGGQLQQLWVDAGGPVDKAAIMAAIGLGESGGNPNAINPGVGAGGRPTKEYSVGIWQINTLVHKNYSVAQLKNPQINAREAVRIYKLQGLRAWGAYTDKRYSKYMPAAGANPPPGTDPQPSPDSPPSTFGQISTGAMMLLAVAVVLLISRD